MNPKATEKTNVDLACHFFHESIINVLDYYYAIVLDQSEWNETAELCCLIQYFWYTINVKDPRAAFKKFDFSSLPEQLRSSLFPSRICHLVK